MRAATRIITAAILAASLTGCIMLTEEGIDRVQRAVGNAGRVVAPVADAYSPGAGEAVGAGAAVILGLLAAWKGFVGLRTAHGRISKHKRETREDREEAQRLFQLVSGEGSAVRSQLDKETERLAEVRAELAESKKPG